MKLAHARILDALLPDCCDEIAERAKAGIIDLKQEFEEGGADDADEPAS